MKKIIILFCGAVIVFVIVNQFFLNTYDGLTFSDSKLESINNGYFISDYIAIQDSINLNNRRIKSPNIWIESSQVGSHYLLFFSKREVIKNEYNLIIDSLNQCNSNEYLFTLKSNYQVLNCVKGLGIVLKSKSQKDSFKLYIKQGAPDVGWKKEITVDSITYIKKE